MLMVYEYDLGVGPLSIQGYYMQSVLGIKPYAKFQTYLYGSGLAFAYWDLLKYRKIDNEWDKKE